MTGFSISPSKINPQIQEMYNIHAKLKQCGNDIDNIRNALKSSSAIDASISNSLKAISEHLLEESKSCNKMAAGLSASVKYYVDTEKSIVAGATGKKGVPSQKKNNPTNFNFKDYLNKAVYKTVIAAAGPAGLVADAIIMGSQGNAGNVVSDIVKFAGGLAKNTKGGSVNWAKWFGLVKPDVGPVQYALNKYFDFSSVGKGISSACNWAAAIITSGYSNFKEFGNFGKRFWEETAVESLIKVGETIAVTAGVAAVIAAAGISAPAIAVTAATAGAIVLIDMGLDAVVSWATHGSQTSWIEAASDAICDTGEKVVDWAKDAGQKASQWAKNTAEGVGNTISKGFNSIKNSFLNLGGSKCKWGMLGA